MKRSLILFVYFLLLILRTAEQTEQLCSVELSVDITESDYDELTGTRIHNDISYSKFDYYVQNKTIRGCVCNIRTCVRKCCDKNKDIKEDRTCGVMEKPRKFLRDIPAKETHEIVYNFLNCGNRVRLQLYPINGREIEEFKINSRGYLVHKNVINITADVNNYCLEYFASMDILGALVCDPYTEGIQQSYYFVGMIISMPFLLATFLVYAFLPDRNLPAKALMCYVISLLFAYIILVTIQLNSNHENSTCITLAFLCYFFFMASFFWMNASCLDIFFTFSGIRGLMGDRRKETRRFLYYCAYAWGAPVLLVCIVAIFTFLDSVDQGSSFYTGLGNGQCWFRSGWATGIYFYFPIATLLIINIVLFGVTTYKIKRVQRDTKMLKHVDSRKHKYDNNDKQRYDSDLVYLTEIELNENLQSDTINVYEFLEEEDSGCFRFNLYVKLLFAMGINWSMEVISWGLVWKFVSIPDYVWVLTDFCNAVYGVFIFFIFVFKRNIWMLLKKRYLQITGRPQQAHTLTSTHRTTLTSSLHSLSKTLERKITPSCVNDNGVN